MPKVYVGIGSRETPVEALRWMTGLAEHLAVEGWHLRSGYAVGADMAFYEGAVERGTFTNYIPWIRFNNAPRYDPRWVVPRFIPKLMNIAASMHPNWNACSQAVKNLHARNVCQILGENLDSPCKMVVCWTPGGYGGGGTGQAIRIAKNYNIPVFDLYREKDREDLGDLLDNN